MPLPRASNNEYGLSRAHPIRLFVRDNNNEPHEEEEEEEDIQRRRRRRRRRSDTDEDEDDRRITFLVNSQQLRRMEEEEDEAVEEDDEDEEFFPVEDTYVEVDDELNDSVLDYDGDEDDDDDDDDEDALDYDNDDEIHNVYSRLNDDYNVEPRLYVGRNGELRLAEALLIRDTLYQRSHSRSPPPPPPYEVLTRSNLALSLASMLNNLTTSSNTLNSHVRNNNNRHTTVISSSSDNENTDEIHRRWRVLRRNEDVIDHKIQNILNKKISVNISETIFKNHFHKHLLYIDQNVLGMKKFDSILDQRQKLLLLGVPRHTKRSRKRKNEDSLESGNGAIDIDPYETDEVIVAHSNSFLKPGAVFNCNSTFLCFTNVSYEENLVNGIIHNNNNTIFQFNGTIVDFVQEDLRYLTIHGADKFKFQSSLDRNVMLNDHNKFLQFRKKLDKWWKLPPFNSISSKRNLEKVLICHNCLNLVLQNFILLKITVMIDNSLTHTIEDHLQLLISINRHTGELYSISGELDCFQRCSSCNIIHSDGPDNLNTTGNSIIDKILILGQDKRLDMFKPLLINIDLLSNLHESKNEDDIREENVWKYHHPEAEYISDKKLKKNNNQFIKKNHCIKHELPVKKIDPSLIHYDYDELFVTRFVPFFNKQNKEDRACFMDVVFS